VDRTCPGGFPGLPVRCRLRTEARGRAERCLATIAEVHEGSGVTIECLVRDGVPEYEILRLAEALGAELIVLGRTQRNLLNRLLLGSVSREVLACSRRPVMVVPPDALTCHRATQRQVREAQTDHDLSATMEDRS